VVVDRGDGLVSGQAQGIADDDGHGASPPSGGRTLTDLLERLFASAVFRTLQAYPRLTATLLILLATLAIAMVRMPA
jgi:hypothetical protein